MSVREFTTTDRIIVDDVSDGMGALANDAYSSVLVYKPLSVAGGGDRAIFGLNGGGWPYGLYHAGGGDGIVHGGNPGDIGLDINMTAVWLVMGSSKAAGTVAPRGHGKPLGSGSWTHVTGGGTFANDANVVATVHIGDWAAIGNENMRLALIALFASQLSDADYENIESNASTAYLNSLGPVAGWEFNQASTGTAVTDWVGNYDETSLTGTTVIEGDDPAWTFGLDAPPVPASFMSVSRRG